MEVIVQTLLQLQKAKKPRNRLAALQQALYVGRRDAQEESRPIKHANLSKIGSSILLEAVFRQVRTAILLQPIADYYQIVADVCRINRDLASEIQYIRYARHVHPTDRALTKRLAAALVKNGLEIMVTAANHSHDVALYSKAASNFKESVALNRESSKIYAYLAMCYIRLNEFDNALDVMDKAVAFDTRRLENNPDCEEVDAGVSGSPSSSYSSIDIYLLRAKLLQAKGSVERCIADMRVATSLDPNHPEVVAFNSRTLLLAERYYQRGMESFSKGDYQEAIQSVQDALVISPEDLKLLIMLARLYRVSDNASKAYEYIQRASNVFVALSENMIPIPYDLEHQKNLGTCNFFVHFHH